MAHAAASEFVSSAPSQVQVSFISFASEIAQKFDASGGRRPIQDWLSSPRVREGRDLKGYTALYEAISAALGQLAPPKLGDSIYVITDGGENASKEKMSAIEQSLQTSGVRLFAFLLGGLLTQEEQNGAKDLYDLTRRSGGFTVSARPNAISMSVDETGARAAVRTMTRMLQAEISSFYVLGIQIPGSSARGESLRIQIKRTKGLGKSKEVTATYPNKLPGCTVQAAQR